MQMKKYMKWAAIAFVAFYLFSQPTNAAGVVNGALDGVVGAADSLSRFVNSLSIG